MKRTIKVTQEHIDKGRPRTPDCCMVALAMREAIPWRSVEVYACWVDINGENTFDLPQHVIDAIDKFDGNQPVEPFEFEIELEDAE